LVGLGLPFLALAGALAFAGVLHRQQQGAAAGVKAGAAQLAVDRADGKTQGLAGRGTLARQHPAGACLIAALPSAAAAAQLDLPAAKAELRELTAAVQDGAALERLRAAQAHMDQAEEAFK
jgi:hypothetical protein